MSTTLTQTQALEVLVQAARIGQSKGAYTLEDAKLIADAISVFVPAKTAEAGSTGQSTAQPVATESAKFEPVEGC